MIDACRKRFGELTRNDVKRLKTREAENARLKNMVAERDLEIEGHEGRSVKTSGERTDSLRTSLVRDGTGFELKASLYADTG